jgi:hypothetical protein
MVAPPPAAPATNGTDSEPVDAVVADAVGAFGKVVTVVELLEKSEFPTLLWALTLNV